MNIASSALHTPHTNLDHRRRFVVVVVVLFELKQLLQIQQLIAFIFRLKVWLSDGFNVGRLATTVVFVVAVVPFRSDQFSSVFSCGQSNVHSLIQPESLAIATPQQFKASVAFRPKTQME